MSDIDDDLCYCLDNACPDKQRCYRYVNRGKGPWASYAATLRDTETGLCAYLLQIKSK